MSNCQELRKNHQNGFILIEALIATSMLVFSFIAGNKTEVTLVKQKQYSNQESQAVQLANQKIEDLRSYLNLTGYNNITSGTDSMSTKDTLYNRSWTITNYTGYKQVNVTISWTDSSNENLSILVATIISQNDPSLSGELFNNTNKTASLPTPGAGVGDQ